MVQEDFDLQRFVKAQEPIYANAAAELRKGHKRSHWMWFVFPQLKGLGKSAFSDTYGISNIEEARAYLAHPILGARLRECTLIVNDHRTRVAEEIFGFIDAIKYRSCVTLFGEACGEEMFKVALDKFYKGKPDEKTLAILGEKAG
jgi:uncharacterized protein (DUF1810 family)